ncbi:MAG TPA: hypothetical protein VFE78_13675 [Gemmataceae bacterium]|jgi:hypothetical protein|nr:hypothetical protein [Gemmataceae bacterium]
MNLLLAILWLLGGVVLVAYEQFTGDTRFHIRGTHFSVSWLCLVLGAYNLVRWWSARAYRAERRALQIEEARHRAAHFRPREGPPPQPDPNFDFTTKPEPRPPHDQPPANN